MATLTCDLCNGKLVMGTGGVATCESCGIEYSKDRMQEKAQENKGTVEISNIAGIESLMKRGHLFLEDLDWQQANEYFDRALDINPEYAPAYIGKLCAELEIRNEDYLGDVEIPISNISSFQKAIRFSNVENQTRLKDYEETIRKRCEEKERIKDHLHAERKRKIQQAKGWFKFGFSRCWHCGGKISGGWFGNFWNSPCKECGKPLSECFLCGGKIETEKEFIHPNGCRAIICLRCGEDFGLHGFK